MSLSKNLEYEKTSFLSKSNSAFIEAMYLKYINRDPNLPDSCRKYFETLGDEINHIAKEINGPTWSPNKKRISIDELKKKIDNQDKLSVKENENNNLNYIKDQKNFVQASGDSIKAIALIRAYRIRGHLIANLDPLGLMERKFLKELDPESHGFKTSDYSKNIYLNDYLDRKNASIDEILKFLKNKYCSTIGFEYMHISDQ